MKHRNDIDGLRAIAVLAVILFHLRVAPFGGGFIGVDVFFVISGFLITGLILNDIRKDRFSIAHFYERRVRRILPALFTVLAVTSIACCVLLPPDQLHDFGNSLAATVMFSSNLFFWKGSGYFRAPAEMKPLLHTWSLAVEEQFYILYPLFLWIVSKFLRKRYDFALLVALLLSFAFSLWGAHHARSATFYLAPFRAWELVLGGLLAIGVFPPLQHRVAGHALSLVGLLCVLYGIVAL